MDEVPYGPNLKGELTMFPALGLHWTSIEYSMGFNRYIL
jgi:hypothetical protein